MRKGRKEGGRDRRSEDDDMERDWMGVGLYITYPLPVGALLSKELRGCQDLMMKEVCIYTVHEQRHLHLSPWR